MSARRPAAFCAALALATCAAGCGGGSPTASRLRSDATSVCNAAGARAARIAIPSSPAEVAPFLQLGIRALQPELVQLRRLRPPREAASAYSGAVGSFAGELTTMEDTLQRLHHGADPVGEVQGLQRRLAPLEARENAAWEALGVSACMNR